MNFLPGRILGLLFALCFISSLMAQDKSSYRLTPMKYIKPHEKVEDEKNGGESDIWVWEVFSDQDKNVTYSTPGGTKVKKTLDFLDFFFVAEQQGEYIHIYKDDVGWAEDKKKQGPKAEDYGWIQQDQLLLWRVCLHNEQDVSRKAMLLNTTSSIKGKLQPGESKKVSFFKDPGLKNKTDYECPIFSVFYIYKISYFPNSDKPKAFLLGTTHRFQSVTERGNVKGWVDARRVSVWDHRVAALPNTNPDALAERKNDKVKATILRTNDAAIKYRDRQPLAQIDPIWDYDSLKPQDKYSGYFTRFPILSNQQELLKASQVFKIGAIGEVTSVGGEKLSQFEWANTLEKINEGNAMNRNINLIFVLDGTSSMQPYFASVSDGIIESMKMLSADRRNSFNFSVLIYRDKEDKEMVTEYHSLSSDYKVIADWLKGKKASSNPSDHDLCEALNYGLKAALRKTSPPETETNIVILVGDAADNGKAIDDAPVTTKDVIDLLFKYKCNFAAFQVNNPGTDCYSKFWVQTKNILNTLGGNLYRYSKQTAEAMGATKPAPYLPDHYDQNFKLVLQNSPMKVGFLMFSKIGGTIPQATMQKEIVQAINGINDSTNTMLSQAQRLTEEGGLKNISGALLTYLTTLDIPVENLKLLADEHAQVYYEGWTSNTVKSMSQSPWQFDLLFSNDELSDLVSKINKLSIEGSPTNSELRTYFHDAWIQLLKDHFGGNISNKEMEDMQLSELETLVFGAVGSTPLLNLHVRDIQDPALMKDADLISWTDKIDKKRIKLSKISSMIPGHENYSFITIHEERFFWIPQSLLP
jgi:hypothetical protein